jgi:hypothetical protein
MELIWNILISRTMFYTSAPFSGHGVFCMDKAYPLFADNAFFCEAQAQHCTSPGTGEINIRHILQVTSHRAFVCIVTIRLAAITVLW